MQSISHNSLQHTLQSEMKDRVFNSNTTHLIGGLSALKVPYKALSYQNTT